MQKIVIDNIAYNLDMAKAISVGVLKKSSPTPGGEVWRLPGADCLIL